MDGDDGIDRVGPNGMDLCNKSCSAIKLTAAVVDGVEENLLRIYPPVRNGDRMLIRKLCKEHTFLSPFLIELEFIIKGQEMGIIQNNMETSI